MKFWEVRLTTKKEITAWQLLVFVYGSIILGILMGKGLI